MTEFSAEDRQAICETFDRLLSDEAHEDILRKTIETNWMRSYLYGMTSYATLFLQVGYFLDLKPKV